MRRRRHAFDHAFLCALVFDSGGWGVKVSFAWGGRVRWVDGWARGGLITSFNMYIYEVKSFTSKIVFPLLQLPKKIWKFSVMKCLRSKKTKKRAGLYY